MPTHSKLADRVRLARSGCVALACCAIALLQPGGAARAQERASFVITNAQVVDGTGAPARRAAVRVVDGRITEVGAITPSSSDRVVDAQGLVLAPGFIDTHNHSTEGLLTEPIAATQISQGITTLVVGQDGSSPWPIAGYLDKLRREPPAVNVMTAVGPCHHPRAGDGEGLQARRPSR